MLVFGGRKKQSPPSSLNNEAGAYPWKIPLALHKQLLGEFVSFWGVGEKTHQKHRFRHRWQSPYFWHPRNAHTRHSGHGADWDVIRTLVGENDEEAILTNDHCKLPWYTIQLWNITLLNSLTYLKTGWAPKGNSSSKHHFSGANC